MASPNGEDSKRHTPFRATSKSGIVNRAPIQRRVDQATRSAVETSAAFAQYESVEPQSVLSHTSALATAGTRSDAIETSVRSWRRFIRRTPSSPAATGYHAINPGQPGSRLVQRIVLHAAHQMSQLRQLRTVREHGSLWPLGDVGGPGSFLHELTGSAHTPGRCECPIACEGDRMCRPRPDV